VVDIRRRTIIMGILNRTPDSFYDKGATWSFDAFLRRADELARAGADLLDVGGVKAGPGPDVDEAEELDRVIPAVEALHARFDTPLSVDTWRASVLDAACRAGAVVGNDISGFADPDYLDVAAKHDATVVATHIRLRPRVPDPEPEYGDLVADVTAFLNDRAQRARAVGLVPRVRSCCERAACTRGSATRCCSRRRTSDSSASCSAVESRTDARSPLLRSPTA
jgi:dihydropteroate synthase